MNDLLLQKSSSSFSLFISLSIQPQTCFYTVMGFSFLPIYPPLYLSVILFLSFHIPCTNFFDFFKNYFMMSDGGGEGEWGGGILFLFLAPTVPLIFSLLNCIYLCFHSSSCPLRSCLSYPSFTPCSLRLLSSLSFTYYLTLSIIRISSP